MNKTYRTISLIILNSTLILSATENVQQDTPQTVSFYKQTTTQLQHAWHNKWVKIGVASTACALLYTIGVRYNAVPAPSLPALSLLALPVIAKKTIDAQELSQNPKNETTIVTEAKNTQEEAVTTEPIIFSDNKQSEDNNTVNAKTKGFPSRNDLKEAPEALKKWLLKSVHNYTPDYQEDYQ